MDISIKKSIAYPTPNIQSPEFSIVIVFFVKQIAFLIRNKAKQQILRKKSGYLDLGLVVWCHEVNVRPSFIWIRYLKLIFPPAITTVSQYGEGDFHPNYGKNCWEGCDQTQGPCDWCGNESWCCRREPEYEYIGNGCDGTFGGEGKHTCSLNPGILFNIGSQKCSSNPFFMNQFLPGFLGAF